MTTAEEALIDTFAAELSERAYGVAVSRAEALKRAALLFLEERRTLTTDLQAIAEETSRSQQECLVVAEQVMQKETAIERMAAHAQHQQEALATVAKTSPTALLTPDKALGYDASKHFLGTLCLRGHDWQGTGQSLRKRQNKACLECDAASARARRQTKQPSTSKR